MHRCPLTPLMENRGVSGKQNSSNDELEWAAGAVLAVEHFIRLAFLANLLGNCKRWKSLIGRIRLFFYRI